MMGFHWLLRAKRWAQNPPSMKMVIFVIAILAAIVALYLIERFVGVPDWMQVERVRRPRINN